MPDPAAPTPRDRPARDGNGDGASVGAAPRRRGRRGRAAWAAAARRPGFWAVAVLVLGALLVGGFLRAEAAARPDVLRQSADEQSYGGLAWSLAKYDRYEQRYPDDVLEQRCASGGGGREVPRRQGGGTTVPPPLDLPRPDPRTDPCGAIAAKPVAAGPPQDLHWPPGASGFFAGSVVAGALGRPSGDQPAVESDLAAAYWAQAIVGTLTIAAVFALGLVALGPATGVIAAWAAALYPTWADGPLNLLSEPFGALVVTGLALALVLVVRQRERGLRAAAPLVLVSGVLAGALVLTRTDYLLVLPILALAMLLLVGRAAGTAGRLRPWLPALGRVVLLAVTVAVVVLPWTRHASVKEEAFVPVTTGGGPALYVGTYLPGRGTTFGMKRAWASEIRARKPSLARTRATQIPAPTILKVVAERHPELERDPALQREGLKNLRRYAVGQPVAFSVMAGRKVGRMWWRYSRGGFQVTPSQYPTRFHHAAVLLGLLGAAVLLARRRTRRLVVFPLLLVAYQSGLHAIFVAQPRYVVPLMGIVFVVGAGGLVELARPLVVRLRARGRRPAPRPGPPGPAAAGPA